MKKNLLFSIVFFYIAKNVTSQNSTGSYFMFNGVYGFVIKKDSNITYPSVYFSVWTSGNSYSTNDYTLNITI